MNYNDLIKLIMEYRRLSFDKGFLSCLILSDENYKEELEKVDLESQKKFKQILEELDKLY